MFWTFSTIYYFVTLLYLLSVRTVILVFVADTTVYEQNAIDARLLPFWNPVLFIAFQRMRTAERSPPTIMRSIIIMSSAAKLYRYTPNNDSDGAQKTLMGDVIDAIDQ